MRSSIFMVLCFFIPLTGCAADATGSFQDTAELTLVDDKGDSVYSQSLHLDIGRETPIPAPGVWSGNAYVRNTGLLFVDIETVLLKIEAPTTDRELVVEVPSPDVHTTMAFFVYRRRVGETEWQRVHDGYVHHMIVRRDGTIEALEWVFTGGRLLDQDVVRTELTVWYPPLSADSEPGAPVFVSEETEYAIAVFPIWNWAWWDHGAYPYQVLSTVYE